MTDSTTFRQLDSLSTRISSPASDSSLDEWYSRICDIPISELDDSDLSRACRQTLYLDDVVPHAVRRLEADPLAGGLYDGELLVAMKSVPLAFWQHNPRISQQLATVIDVAKELTDEEDIIADADEIGRRVRGEM